MMCSTPATETELMFHVIVESVTLLPECLLCWLWWTCGGKLQDEGSQEARTSCRGTKEEQTQPGVEDCRSYKENTKVSSTFSQDSHWGCGLKTVR